MKYREIIIDTTTEGIEIINGILVNLEINESVVEDSTVYDDLMNSKQMFWDYYDESLEKLKYATPEIKVYFDLDEAGDNKFAEFKYELKRISEMMSEIDMGTLDMDENILNDEDWANNWKQYFKPFEIGDKMIIKPSWEEVENKDNKILLEIDPGASFGTGQHFTTKLCIEQIEKYVSESDEVLDLGCGSGILSIAALLLGAKSAVGVDIDENATRIAVDNAAENNIDASKFKVYTGDIVEDEGLIDNIGRGKYDVLLINIIANVILMLSPAFPKFVKKDGIIITSGIIEQYVDDVRNKLEELNFEILETRNYDEWYSITAKFLG